MLNLKKNDEIKLNIESVTSEGSAIGRYGGVAVFVFGAVPGDVITAHIIKVSKNYAVGIIKEIIEKSKFRIESDCPVSDKCGGCAFRSLTYEKELESKLDFVNGNMERIAKLPIRCEKIIGAENVLRYRNKAQYPVCVNGGNCSVGFYAYKSHRIIPISDCLLQPKEFEAGANAFKKWALANKLSSFDEKNGRGVLRHLYFRKAFSTGEIMACVVANADSLPDSQMLISLLQSAMPGLKSVVLNVNKKKTNVILGEKTKLLWGSEKITDELLGKKFVISPQSFYQVNHAQCEKLYSAAAELAQLTGDEILLDMYCGAGTVGITLSDKCKALYGIEIVPQAIENAIENAKLNNVSNAEFICADAYEGARILTEKSVRPDVVILDPPRKGCQKELFDIISGLGVEKIVYISCNSATLARDLQILAQTGYEAKRLKAVDLFPRTPHVEAVCLLGRKIVNDKNVESAHVDYEPKDAECLKSAKGSAS